MSTSLPFFLSHSTPFFLSPFVPPYPFLPSLSSSFPGGIFNSPVFFSSLSFITRISLCLFFVSLLPLLVVLDLGSLGFVSCLTREKKKKRFFPRYPSLVNKVKNGYVSCVLLLVCDTRPTLPSVSKL